MVLLFLESLGTTELLVILVVALVLFGPRRLPEMTRKFGKSLNDFKRASDDFKRTWEREVAMENIEREAAVERAMVGAEPHAAEFANEGGAESVPEADAPRHDITAAAFAPIAGAPIARGASIDAPAAAGGTPDETPAATAGGETTAAPEAARKTDWL